MDRPRSLDHVKFTKAKGKWYAYFNTGRKVNGKTVYTRLPPIGSPGFYEAYSTLLGHRRRKTSAVLTVADLVRDYEKSIKFRALASATQVAYSVSLRRLVKELGKAPAGKVERRHIREIIEQRIEGAGTRNMFIRIVGALYAWARENDLVENKPTDGLKISKSEPYEPWPEALLRAGLASDNDRVRLAVHLLYYTGQRIGDVCAMRWDAIEGDAITVTQQKTGKTLRVHLAEPLAAELARTERKAATILTNHWGKPLAGITLRKDLKAFAQEHGHDVVPHGLRKNAVISLLMAECTVPQVAAITGQTHAIVEHYAKRIDQYAMGRAAIEKRDGTNAARSKDRSNPLTKPQESA